MKTVSVHEAKTQLSSLLEAAQRGEDIVIARYGKPIARLSALDAPRERPLGFWPITFGSDLAAPTDEDILSDFEGQE